MKKNLAFVASTLLTVGLFAALVNHQGNTVRAEAIEPIKVTIANVSAESYSYYGRYYVCFVNETKDMEFSFRVENDAEVAQNLRLTPNKTYTLDNMGASASFATISGEKFDYETASLKLNSDENGYIGYEADVKLNNGVYYSIREAEPMSGEMVIDGYKDEYGTITLTDTETGSRFHFEINNIEDGVTYNLSNFSGTKYCFIGDRYWNYKEATFKRTTDAAGIIHVEATVLTQHGDSLSLKYNEYNELKPIPQGLSGGAIAGIVIGSVLVAGLGGFAVFWFVIKKKTFADFLAIFKKK